MKAAGEFLADKNTNLPLIENPTRSEEPEQAG